MKPILSLLLICSAVAFLIACSDNKAAEVKMKSPLAYKAEPKPTVKTDGSSIGFIETDNYVMKLHRAFTYSPDASPILTGFTPKEGYKFIYLDVSLKNKGIEPLNGGFLFIALKVTDEKGIEYKKPSAALAAYTSEHPEDNNTEEYNALWETFQPNEFHRELIYAVEVPASTKNLVLHMPTDRTRKEWKELKFSI